MNQAPGEIGRMSRTEIEQAWKDGHINRIEMVSMLAECGDPIDTIEDEWREEVAAIRKAIGDGTAFYFNPCQ